MNRSCFNNRVFEGIHSSVYREAALFYRETLDSMKASGELKDLESFHRFKLAIKQYKLIRAKAQAFTTFEQLVDWMNDEPFELFANPFLVQEPWLHVSNVRHRVEGNLPKHGHGLPFPFPLES